MKNILIIGYGQLGHSVCQRHIPSSDQVFTVSRQPHSELSPLHHHIIADLDNLDSSLSFPDTIDSLYYFAPPSDKDLTDQRLRVFLSLHKSLAINHFIYISTSGVYGDSRGEWVTENTAVNPAAARSKRRLDAEQQLIKYSNETNTKLTVLRCAAIYSSQSISRERISANHKPVIKLAQAPFTNRIHLTDLTEVCIRAMLNRPERFEIYNVSDGHPSTTTEHAWLLSDLAGIERNPEIDISEAEQYYSPAYLSYLSESKRLDTTKLKQQLAPDFKFENCAEGIKQCLQLTPSYSE